MTTSARFGEGIEEAFQRFHLNSIRDYLIGKDSLETAQASWRILSDDGLTPANLAQKVGQPLSQIQEVLCR